MQTEIVHYTDGGHAERTATLERDGDRATLVVGAQRVPLDLLTRDPGGAIAKGVTTALAVASYAILGLMKQWNRNYGDRVGFEVDGRKVIGLYQEHPPDKGKNYPHPGLTLLEPTGAETAPPGAPGPVLLLPDLPPQPGDASTAPGASAGDLLVAGCCAAVGLLLFGAAVSGFGGASHSAVNALRDFTPTRWEASWLRERPEVYAEMVARIAHPDAYREAVESGDALWPTYASRLEPAVRWLYDAMEAKPTEIAWMSMPSVRLPSGGSETAYEHLHRVIRDGNPRAVLSDDERAALRDFMVAAAAYRRLCEAGAEEAKHAPNIDDFYFGAPVSLRDAALVLVRGEDALQEQVIHYLQKTAGDVRAQIQQARVIGDYQHKSSALESRLSELTDALQQVRTRRRVPFMIFRMMVAQA